METRFYVEWLEESKTYELIMVNGEVSKSLARGNDSHYLEYLKEHMERILSTEQYLLQVRCIEKEKDLHNLKGEVLQKQEEVRDAIQDYNLKVKINKLLEE